MSFSNDVKSELLSAPVKMNCCRKALLFGLLYNSRHKEGTHLCATFGMRESASLAASLIILLVNITILQFYESVSAVRINKFFVRIIRFYIFIFKNIRV